MGSSTYKALDGVTLNISKGEYAAIVGPSGAGKSTLMNIIGCLDKPTNGEYILDGLNTNCSDNKLAEIRNKKIGFIFQNYNLLPKLNVFQNIELPLLYLGYSSSKIKEKVLRAIEKVDLESHIKHKPSELTALQTPEVTIELWIKLVY
ncbi:ABC transporter ATP-binding protein [Candidatus Clostridium stratigraminis]|uniref:ABC transporter ATP-binding protein n=1 Tax=Candidatus Clostridium stratigraminis TaxID=3381661 RepID=A0ABW8T2S6_9CLOT